MTTYFLAVVERTALSVALCAIGTGRAAELHIDLLTAVLPESIEIYQGDTVVWHANGMKDVESYTGEWKSPVLRQGETYSYTFEKPGTYIYRAGQYSDVTGTFSGDEPAAVRVIPFQGSRPAVSIVAPPNGFLVHELVLMEALVTNASADVQAVHFFRGEELFDTATNPPYRTRVTAPVAGDYEYRAAVIDRAGHTNTSPPIILTILAPSDRPVFNPALLPGGRFAFNYSLWFQRSPFPLFSYDLNTNIWRNLRSHIGLNLIISDDRRVTNAPKVFFKVDPAPL